MQTTTEVRKGAKFRLRPKGAERVWRITTAEVRKREPAIKRNGRSSRTYPGLLTEHRTLHGREEEGENTAIGISTRIEPTAS